MERGNDSPPRGLLVLASYRHHRHPDVPSLSTGIMKLPTDSEISMKKLTHYLLVPRSKSDKSGWLERGGYTQDNPQRLADDIRSQLLILDATPSRQSPFGETFEIRGQLTGPTSVSLPVRTIWLKDPLSGKVRFVTLIPATKPHA